MKISTKGRYGVKAMLDLAIYSSTEPVTVKSIAERQSISEGYLEQVFSALRKGGLVNSIKGAQGGYVLGRCAAEITVGDILRRLEGDLLVADESERGTTNIDLEYCISTHVWKTLNSSINNIVDSITLENLIAEYKKINEDNSLGFYI